MADRDSARYVRLEQIGRYLRAGTGPKLIFIETNFVEQFRSPSWKEALEFRRHTLNAKYDLVRLSVSNVEVTAPLMYALDYLRHKDGIVLNGIRLQPENVSRAAAFFKNKDKIDLTGKLFTFEAYLPRIMTEFSGELNIYRTSLSTSANFLCRTFISSSLTTVNIQNIRYKSMEFEKRVIKALQGSLTLEKLSYDCRKKSPMLFESSQTAGFPLVSVTFSIKITNHCSDIMRFRPMINFFLRKGCTLLFDGLRICGWQKLHFLCVKLTRYRGVQIYIAGNEERPLTFAGISGVDVLDQVIDQLQVKSKVFHT